MRRIAVAGMLALLPGCVSQVELMRDAIKADLEKRGEVRCETSKPEPGSVREQCWQDDKLYTDCTSHLSGLVACQFPQGVSPQ